MSKKKSSKNKESKPKLSPIIQLSKNDVLDDICIIDEVGRGLGGFGVIYSAMHQNGGDPLAVKLFCGNGTDKLRLAKFDRETEILSRLKTL